MLGLRAKDKGIEIKLEIDSALPSNVRSDNKRLQQILINLLSNAIKFSEHDSEIFLKAELYCHTTSLTTVRISVHDQGIGIRPEHISNLFKEFGRIRNAQNDRLNPQGVGLGLWISDSLASRIGSPLYVFSSYGLGSTFVFDLSLENAETPTGAPKALFENPDYQLPEDPYNHEITKRRCESDSDIIIDEVEPEVELFQDLTNKYGSSHICCTTASGQSEDMVTTAACSFKNHDQYHHPTAAKNPLLMVDDDYTNRFVIQLFCDRVDLGVDFAMDGKQALEMYTQSINKNSTASHYQCILMDYQMPELTGPDVVRRIREIERNQTLARSYIVGHTAFSSAQELEVFQSSGIDDVLSKPVTTEGFENIFMKMSREKK